MHGWAKVWSPRLFCRERSSMSPTARHYEFTNRLACPRRQLSVLQFGRQRVRVTGKTDREGGNGIPFFRDSKRLPRLLRVEACHLVNDQAARRRLDG